MKTFRKYVVLICTCAFTAVSCSDDGPAPIKPQLPSGDSDKLLSIVHSGNTNECFDWHLYYSNDRLTKAEGSKYKSEQELSYTSNLTYHHDAVTIKNSGKRNMIVRLNTLGYIEFMTVNSDEYEFFYQNGRLAGWSKSSNDDNFGANKYKTKATISYDSQGNLATIKYEKEENTPITLQITSSKELNNNGLLPETISQEIGLFGFEHLYYAGLFGRPTKNLVSKIKVSGYKDTEKNTTVDFNYYRDEKTNNITLCNYSYMGKQASVNYTYQTND